MRKFVIILISAIVFTLNFDISAQTERNQTEGCSFRFVLESTVGTGWVPESGITVIVDGIEKGFINLPWGTPSAEEILLLPSGEIHFLWLDYLYFTPLRHYFEIYNSFNERIYTSPNNFLSEELLFSYQNECPECIPLSDFEGKYNQETKVIILSWIVPESENVTGFDIYRNGVPIKHVTPTTNSYSENTENFEPGNYTYCVVPVYPYSCTFDENCFVTNINVGVKNFSAAFYVYPNPAKEELKIENGELKIKNVEIFDVYGRKQKSRKAEKQNGEGTMVIDIANLAKGIYFIEITTEKGMVVKKVIKQ